MFWTFAWGTVSFVFRSDGVGAVAVNKSPTVYNWANLHSHDDLVEGKLFLHESAHNKVCGLFSN